MTICYANSPQHAFHSAEIFSQCKPVVVGTGGLTLFPGTPLLEEAQRGEFDPLSEKEMLEELKLFVENLTCDCSFITHHTVPGANLTGSNVLKRKNKIVAALEDEMKHGDMNRMAAFRRNKRLFDEQFSSGVCRGPDGCTPCPHICRRPAEICG